MVDDILPIENGSFTVSIENNVTDNDSLLLYGHTATVTAVFPEPVNNWSQGDSDTNDCSSESGAVANLARADFLVDNATGTMTSDPRATVTTGNSCLGTTWTATFTPTTDREVLFNTISIAGSSWTDQVGNAGFDNVSPNFDIDTYRPRATVSFTHNAPDVDDQNYTSPTGTTKKGFRPGDNGTLTVTWTDIPQDIMIYDFSNADVDAPYVDLDNLTTTDNITWTGYITPAAVSYTHLTLPTTPYV